MMPNGWKTLSLGEITKEKISYGIVQAGPHVENGVPYIKSSNVGGEIKIEDLQRTSSEIHHKYRRSAVHPNDIVFSLRGNIGRTSIVPPELLEANLTQGTARISVNTKNETNFVYYSLASTPILNRINSLSKGSTFKEISLEELRKVKLPIPPLPEQQKIAKILSTWDKAISTTERLIVNSTQQKKALMQQLLTGKKRLLEESGKRFEGEWARQPINFVADVITGNTPSTKNQEYYGGDRLFVSPSDLGISKYILETTKRLTDLGFNQTRKVPKGSSLFTCIGSTIGKLGIAGEELATNQQINSVCAKGNNCGEFIYYQLLFHAEQIKGSAATQAVPIINKTNFESQLIFSPPSHKEQQKIATVLTNTDKEVELLEQQLADLQQEKKALMQVLLTGKKRVVVDGEVT
ncbi:restriction endonuclease subunit S [Psychrobacter glacincola]|uniref:restriction endonuclease subunit S n=1 Tax=Psychrobacter glacincola TaxID=56810 RepID=UPI0039AEF8B3